MYNKSPETKGGSVGSMGGSVDNIGSSNEEVHEPNPTSIIEPSDMYDIYSANGQYDSSTNANTSTLQNQVHLDFIDKRDGVLIAPDRSEDRDTIAVGVQSYADTGTGNKEEGSYSSEVPKHIITRDGNGNEYVVPNPEYDARQADTSIDDRYPDIVPKYIIKEDENGETYTIPNPAYLDAQREAIERVQEEKYEEYLKAHYDEIAEEENKLTKELDRIPQYIDSPNGTKIENPEYLEQKTMIEKLRNYLSGDIVRHDDKGESVNYNESTEIDYWMAGNQNIPANEMTDSQIENLLDTCYQSILDGDYMRNALNLISTMNQNLEQFGFLQSENIGILEGMGAGVNLATYEMALKAQKEICDYLEKSTVPAMNCIGDLQICLTKRNTLQKDIEEKELELEEHLRREPEKYHTVYHDAEYNDAGECIRREWEEDVIYPAWTTWDNKRNTIARELEQLKKDYKILNEEALQLMQKIGEFEQKNIEFKINIDDLSAFEARG